MRHKDNINKNRINKTGQELSSNHKVLRTKTYYLENLQETTLTPSLRQPKRGRKLSVDITDKKVLKGQILKNEVALYRLKIVPIYA